MKLQQLLSTLGLSLFVMCSSFAHAEWDWKADLESPVTTDAKWILLSGTVLTIGTAALHKSTFADWETWQEQNKPLGESSKYGDALGQLLPNGVYVVGQLIGGYYGLPKGYYRAWMMFEASAYAGIVTTVLKYAIREPRPYDYSVRNSFPSGHSTTAFAFAGIIAAEHGWYWGVPAMAMATFVGYSRINDNEHRVHDVVAGATVGLSCAYGIYYAHAPEREKFAKNLMLVPQAMDGGGTGVAALWTY